MTGPLARFSFVVVAAFAIAACSAESLPQDGNAATTAIDAPILPAYVDEESGIIALPADQFFLSEAELDNLGPARDIAMFQCLQAAGLTPVDTPRRYIPDNDVSRMYGLWRMSDAEQYGYVIYEVPEKLAAIERNAQGNEISDAEMAERHRCAKTPEVSRFDGGISPGVWLGELSVASQEVRDSPEWAAVISDWAECLERVEVEVDIENLAPVGVDSEAVQRGEVTENDVRLAIADVTCKNEVSFIKRLTDLEAAAQSPIIARHRDEMLAERARLDALLVQAREVLAEAGL